MGYKYRVRYKSLFLLSHGNPEYRPHRCRSSVSPTNSIVHCFRQSPLSKVDPPQPRSFSVGHPGAQGARRPSPATRVAAARPRHGESGAPRPREQRRRRRPRPQGDLRPLGATRPAPAPAPAPPSPPASVTHRPRPIPTPPEPTGA